MVRGEVAGGFPGTEWIRWWRHSAAAPGLPRTAGWLVRQCRSGRAVSGDVGRKHFSEASLHARLHMQHSSSRARSTAAAARTLCTGNGGVLFFFLPRLVRARVACGSGSNGSGPHGLVCGVVFCVCESLSVDRRLDAMSGYGCSWLPAFSAEVSKIPPTRWARVLVAAAGRPSTTHRLVGSAVQQRGARHGVKASRVLRPLKGCTNQHRPQRRMRRACICV